MKKAITSLLLSLCIYANSQQLFPFMDTTRKWGYVDNKGKWIIKPKYADAWPFFSSGKALVAKIMKIDGSHELVYGVINKKGKTVKKFRYNNIDDRLTARKWYMVHTTDDTGGFLDTNGNEVIPFKYFGFSDQGGYEAYFNNGYARALNKKLWKDVYVDTAGTEIIPKTDYFGLGVFSNGLAAVETGWTGSKKLVAFIDKTGSVKIPPKYIGDIFTVFSEGLAEVHDTDKKCGYIDTKGNVAIPFTDAYTYGRKFQEGMAHVYKENSGHGFIDRSGKIIVPCVYDDVSDFHNGIAFVSKKYPATGIRHAVYIIDKTGKVLHEVICDNSSFWHFPLVSIERNKKWALLDTSGKTPGDFISTSSIDVINAYPDKDNENFIQIRKGKSTYSSDDSVGCVNAKTFKTIVPCIYREIRYSDPFFYVSAWEGGEGLYNKEGKMIVPCVFDKINYFVNGTATATQDYSPLPGCRWTGKSTEDGTEYHFNEKSFIIDTSGNIYEYSSGKINKVEQKEKLRLY